MDLDIFLIGIFFFFWVNEVEEIFSSLFTHPSVNASSHVSPSPPPPAHYGNIQGDAESAGRGHVRYVFALAFHYSLV